MTDTSKLFEPLQVGNITINNRLAMAPMTRQRSYLNGTPTDLNVEHYRQRASAGLIITEGIAPSEMRSEEHTSELQSRPHLVCRLLLEKKKIQEQVKAE